MKNVIIIGAGGNGKVVADIIKKNGREILGFIDDNLDADTGKYHHLGTIREYKQFIKNNEFINTIGDNYIRKSVNKILHNVTWYTAIHPSVQIGSNVVIGSGTMVMPNVVINANTHIGKHVILNTGAIIEHDNIIDDYVHISPRVVLGGNVKIGKKSHAGIGSIVKNNISIIADCTIGAGATVVKDINKKGVYIGVPAKLIEKIVLG